MRKKQRPKQNKPASGHITKQFWPRLEAIRIIELDDRDQMIEAIELVPDRFREWVRFYINDWITKAGGLTKLKRQFEKDNLREAAKYG